MASASRRANGNSDAAVTSLAEPHTMGRISDRRGSSLTRMNIINMMVQPQAEMDLLGASSWNSSIPVEVIRMVSGLYVVWAILWAVYLAVDNSSDNATRMGIVVCRHGGMLLIGLVLVYVEPLILWVAERHSRWAVALLILGSFALIPTAASSPHSPVSWSRDEILSLAYILVCWVSYSSHLPIPAALLVSITLLAACIITLTVGSHGLSAQGAENMALHGFVTNLFGVWLCFVNRLSRSILHDRVEALSLRKSQAMYIGRIAHDIKTPLATFKYGVDHLRDLIHPHRHSTRSGSVFSASRSSLFPPQTKSRSLRSINSFPEIPITFSCSEGTADMSFSSPTRLAPGTYLTPGPADSSSGGGSVTETLSVLEDMSQMCSLLQTTVTAAVSISRLAQGGTVEPSVKPCLVDDVLRISLRAVKGLAHESIKLARRELPIELRNPILLDGQMLVEIMINILTHTLNSAMDLVLVGAEVTPATESGTCQCVSTDVSSSFCSLDSHPHGGEYRDCCVPRRNRARVRPKRTSTDALRPTSIRSDEEAPAEYTPRRRSLEDSHLTLYVVDRGTRLSAETKQHLFDPFGDSPGKGRGGATLNLTLVRHLVEALGGAYGVRDMVASDIPSAVIYSEGCVSLRSDPQPSISTLVGTVLWVCVPLTFCEDSSMVSGNDVGSKHSSIPSTVVSSSHGSYYGAQLATLEDEDEPRALEDLPPSPLLGSATPFLTPSELIMSQRRASRSTLGEEDGEGEDKASTHGPLHVLVVDDTAMLRRLVGRRLEMSGYVAATAEDGREGLEMMQETQYDAVIMDFDMPVLNGIECVRLFRLWEDEVLAEQTEPHRHRTLILGCSASIDEQKYAEAREVGMDGFLSKPFNMGTFTAAVAESRPILTRCHT